MSLDGTAIIEFRSRSRDAEFHLREGLDYRGEVNRSFLMGARGQYITEIVDQGGSLIPEEIADSTPGRRRGYHIDGGAGSWEITLSGEYGIESPGQWGDGSGDPEFDATFSDDPLHMQQIAEAYFVEGRTDSEGQLLLHIGEWTDGSYGSEGAFGRPLPLAVESFAAERSSDSPSNIEVTIGGKVTALFPGISDYIDDIQDAIADLIPDW